MSTRPPVTPRPAATILLVRDDPFEVLMVRRTEKAFFSAALVFPGGTVEEDDRHEDWRTHVTGVAGLDEEERAFRIAAFRETFEECGLLIARDGEERGIAPVPGGEFAAVIRSSGGRLPLDALVPFGHWITPEPSPKRYDTRFYLCAAPRGQVAVCDGGETVALEWVRPVDALARAAAGERSILFPTRLNLKRLAESSDVASALEAARARKPFTVRPRVEKRPGGIVVVIPAEAGYGETENFHPHSA